MAATNSSNSRRGTHQIGHRRVPGLKGTTHFAGLHILLRAALCSRQIHTARDSVTHLHLRHAQQPVGQQVPQCTRCAWLRQPPLATPTASMLKAAATVDVRVLLLMLVAVMVTAVIPRAVGCTAPAVVATPCCCRPVLVVVVAGAGALATTTPLAVPVATKRAVAAAAACIRVCSCTTR